MLLVFKYTYMLYMTLIMDYLCKKSSLMFFVSSGFTDATLSVFMRMNLEGWCCLYILYAYCFCHLHTTFLLLLLLLMSGNLQWNWLDCCKCIRTSSAVCVHTFPLNWFHYHAFLGTSFGRGCQFIIFILHIVAA